MRDKCNVAFLGEPCLRRDVFIATLLMMFATALSLWAQSAQPTSNILTRMAMIKAHTTRGSVETGTAFSIDVERREYWITAKHILTGAESPPFGSVAVKNTVLEILDPSKSQDSWVPVSFSVIEPGNEIDIVILAPEKPLLVNPIPNPAPDSVGVAFGGDCEFLGYPFGSSWTASVGSSPKLRFPFIKHCTVSGRLNEPSTVWVLDGINNSGFSGGPVIFGTGAAQKIIAVVSGYKPEPSPVVPDPSQVPRPEERASDRPKEIVNMNSGFIFAYDISYAVDAIKKNPIGPLRTP